MKKKKTKKKATVVPEVKSQAITIVNQSVLEPEMVNSKYSLPKTWLTEQQLVHIVQKTPADHVYTRPAKGGGTWDYVTGTYVQKVLNYVFGWNWDFEVVRDEEKYGAVIVLGKLTVKDGRGQSVVKMQYGRSEIKYKKGGQEVLDYGNDLKAAATDALKKCASELGIASDIYGKNEFRALGKQVVDNAPSVVHNSISAPTKNMVQYECHECANPMTQAEVQFSERQFNKRLCRDCQNLKRKEGVN